METQTQPYRIISNEEYEIWGHKVRRIYRVDGKVVPIIANISRVVRIIYGMGYFECSRCLIYDGSYYNGLYGYALVPSGAIVLIEYWEEGERKYRCGMVEEGAEMKLAVLGPVVKNVKEIECPSTEEVAKMHAKLINDGFCINPLLAEWMVMAIVLAKRLYGIEI